MKKKIMLTVFTVLSLGIGVAVFAFTSTAGVATATMSCCPKGADSCPMKMKHDGQASMNHDSCPMKHKDGAAASCDCPCCHQDQQRKDGDTAV